MLARTSKAGDKVVLTELPPGLIDDLPDEDQRAIIEVVGLPLTFNEIDEDGRAELEFTDRSGVTHTIWVHPSFIRISEAP